MPKNISQGGVSQQQLSAQGTVHDTRLANIEASMAESPEDFQRLLNAGWDINSWDTNDCRGAPVLV